MAADYEACRKALGTHAWESVKDWGQRVKEEHDVEDVTVRPLTKFGDHSSVSLSILRKGEGRNSSLELICTSTGTPTVAMFVRGIPVQHVDVPQILTRGNVDAIVERFVKRVFR